MTVKVLKEYDLRFGGLKQGIHTFNYIVDKKFFACFEDTELRSGKVQVDISMEKQEKMLILDFSINGNVSVVCDRCLDEYDQEVSGKRVLFIKFGESFSEESDEIVVIPETDHMFNVSQYIYEYIHLLLPMKKVHKDGQCNSEMIDRLNKYSQKKNIDSRWESLGELRDSFTDKENKK